MALPDHRQRDSKRPRVDFTVSEGHKKPGQKHGPEIEGFLDQWVQAKKTRQFGLADQLRNELRLLGVEPDECRPVWMQHVTAALKDKRDDGNFKAVPIYDAATEKTLDDWVASKRKKDFGLADQIREQLRQIGVDPDAARPSPQAYTAAQYSHTGQAPKFDDETEDNLNKWVRLKRDKSFREADALRDALRSRGIDPDTARPVGHSSWLHNPAAASIKFDQATEDQLDQWVVAKKTKDFKMADMIREDLRSRGIDPDTIRPISGGGKGGKGDELVSAPPPMFDEETERELDQWVQAKRDKDFNAAEWMQNTLRAKGVDPDTVRPFASTYTNPDGPVQLDDHTNQQLDAWVNAKRIKDFDEADRLRKDLRSRGIDPDRVRPHPNDIPPELQSYHGKGGKGKGGGGKGKWEDHSYNSGYQNQNESSSWDYDNTKNAWNKDEKDWWDSYKQEGNKQQQSRRNRDSQSFPGTIDHHAEKQLDLWVQAKRNKDFALADELRNDLRSKGVDPDAVRPANTPVPSAQVPQFDQTVEDQLDAWVMAKRNKDFPQADYLRETLRSKGVDPDTVRPMSGKVYVQPGQQQFDVATEIQLEQWVQAKRSKDFAQADAIRDELRVKGIDPDVHRPKDMAYASLAQLPKYDDVTENELDDWVRAKRNKDFKLADNMRDMLRKKGVDPDIVRPQWYQFVMNARKAAEGGGNSNGYQVPPPALRNDDWGGRSGGQRDNRSHDSGGYQDSGGYGQQQQQDSGGYGQQQKRGASALADSTGIPTYDDATEARLDQWVQAKRGKDYRLADNIRAELRDQGVDPDFARPVWYQAAQKIVAEQKQQSALPDQPPEGEAPVVLPTFSPDIELMLDQWVQAKRNKRFEVADALRQALRGKGVDPDTVRPAWLNYGINAIKAEPAAVPDLSQLPKFDDVTEAELDEWVSSKRCKDFARADELRDILRGKGVDPDAVRPQWIQYMQNAQAEKEQAHYQQVVAQLQQNQIVGQSLMDSLQYETPYSMKQRDSNAEIEAKLDKWVSTKRNKQYDVADEIRAELRAQGIDPDTRRPDDHKGPKKRY